MSKKAEKSLSDAYFDAKIDVDTAENDATEKCGYGIWIRFRQGRSNEYTRLSTKSILPNLKSNLYGS